MAILALDTCGHACSLAIVEPSGPVLFSQTDWMMRGHAPALAHMAQAAFHLFPAAGITAVAVTRGPGGFTGMRAGLAYARAFALARDVSIYGMDVFSALRLTVGGTRPCFLDTRRGDLFYDGSTATALNLPPPATNSFGLIERDAAISALHAHPLSPAGSIWKTAAATSLRDSPPPDPGWIEPCPVVLANGVAQAQDPAQDCTDVSTLYVRAPSLGAPG